MEPKSIWERWTFWIPAVLGIIAAITGYRGYVTSQTLARAALEPKLAIQNVTLARSPVFKDTATVDYTVSNKGSVSLHSLRANFNFSIKEDHEGEWFAAREIDSGVNLAPTEEIPINVGLFDVKDNGHVGLAHYADVVVGKKHLTIDIRTTAVDSNGTDLKSCESFYYVVASGRFQRISDCDIADQKVR